MQSILTCARVSKRKNVGLGEKLSETSKITPSRNELHVRNSRRRRLRRRHHRQVTRAVVHKQTWALWFVFHSAILTYRTVHTE